MNNFKKLKKSNNCFIAKLCVSLIQNIQLNNQSNWNIKYTIIIYALFTHKNKN